MPSAAVATSTRRIDAHHGMKNTETPKKRKYMDIMKISP